jgi:Flp pilus assembly protein TadD
VLRRGDRRPDPRLELDLTNAQAIAMRGVTHYATGRYDEAIADLTRAIQLDPSNSEYRSHLGTS